MIHRIYSTFSKKGVFVGGKHLLKYIYYHYKEKYEFVYFYVDMKSIPYGLSQKNNSINVRIASHDDVQKIVLDVYPFLSSKEENDKRYIEKIGENYLKCFIAEQDGVIIHYSLLFERAKESPLMKTAIDKSNVFPNDAYLGTVFTVPSARGMWVVPEVLLNILVYLNSCYNKRRLYAIVHIKTPGAVAYYKRLGFTRILKQKTL